MEEQFINRMHFSLREEDQAFPIPHSIRESFRVAKKYFEQNTNNKICIVFPTKENSAQWLTFLIALDLIYNDFKKFKSEIFESYRRYRPGQLLILNNEAIVKWIGYDDKYIKFSTKPEGKGAAPTRFASHLDVIKLQPAPASRKAVSSYNRVAGALNTIEKYPIDKLFDFYSAGNKQFIKSSVCLVDRFKDYDNVLSDILLNQYFLKEYINAEKISDDGTVNNFSPLLLSNNLERIIHNNEGSNPAGMLVIDGIGQIEDGISNFNDLEANNLRTILLTDLSESESFEKVSNLGFGFYYFTKNNIRINTTSERSPFFTFEKKIYGFTVFKSEKVVCRNTALEQITGLIHKINGNEQNDDFAQIRYSIIRLTNSLARVCHIPGKEEILSYRNIIDSISERFETNRLWLGDSGKVIGEVLDILKGYIRTLEGNKTEKCIKLQELLDNNFDYVICANDEESKILKSYLKNDTVNVISLSDINESLISKRDKKAILTGWPKAVNFNRIIHSFLFPEITFLFYSFENKYYNSLQRKNRNFLKSINLNINIEGIQSGDDDDTVNDFSNLYNDDKETADAAEPLIDISEFELKIENTQYSKYYAKGNPEDSCKARRIDFGNNAFIYATETHKFIIINELVDSRNLNPSIYYKKIDALKTGDVIAFINTDRDVLVEMVRNSTNREEYEKIESQIDLWKNLLEKKYAQLGYNFRSLVRTLNNYGCKRHEGTIRTWLTDENMIGPESDKDLIIIGRMTGSEYLIDNIREVREAIKIMTGWRMKAAEVIREKIKNKFLEIADKSVINTYIEIQELGRVEFLKVSEIKKEVEEIDKKYVHRLIPKEFI